MGVPRGGLSAGCAATHIGTPRALMPESGPGVQCFSRLCTWVHHTARGGSRLLGGTEVFGGHNLLVILCWNFLLKDSEDRGLGPALAGRQRIRGEAPGPDSEKEPGTHTLDVLWGRGKGLEAEGLHCIRR